MKKYFAAILMSCVFLCSCTNNDARIEELEFELEDANELLEYYREECNHVEDAYFDLLEEYSLLEEKAALYDEYEIIIKLVDEGSYDDAIDYIEEMK